MAQSYKNSAGFILFVDVSVIKHEVFVIIKEYTSFSLCKSRSDCIKHGVKRHPDPEDWIFNRVISNISVLPRKTTLRISDSIETGSLSPVESETVRVVSCSTTETTRIKQFGKKNNLQGSDTLTHFQTTNFRLFQTEKVCRRQFQI